MARKIKIQLDSDKLKKRLDLKDGKTPVKGVDFFDGKDYILTEKDKNDIAKSIKVPVVEKIIEKTTVEQPIITNEIKEVAVPDTGIEIVEKINELPIEKEYQIGREHIFGLDDYQEISRLAKLRRTDGLGGSTARNFYQLGDVPQTYAGQAGKTLSVNAGETGLEFTANLTTDEKVKYDAGDPTAGYIADKFIAGEGITLSEGIGSDANKLKISNTWMLDPVEEYWDITSGLPVDPEVGDRYISDATDFTIRHLNANLDRI